MLLNDKKIKSDIKHGIYIQLNREGLIDENQLSWLLKNIN